MTSDSGTGQSSPPADAGTPLEMVAIVTTELFGRVSIKTTDTLPAVLAASHRTAPAAPRCQIVQDVGRLTVYTIGAGSQWQSGHVATENPARTEGASGSIPPGTAVVVQPPVAPERHTDVPGHRQVFGAGGSANPVPLTPQFELHRPSPCASTPIQSSARVARGLGLGTKCHGVSISLPLADWWSLRGWGRGAADHGHHIQYHE